MATWVEPTANGDMWWFEDRAALARVRERANAMGRERLAALSEGRASRASEAPRCLVVEEEEEDEWTSWEYPRGGKELSAAEETQLKRWYELQMTLLCGKTSPVARLRRSVKVTCTAVMLFKRFFLSHSIMECDPLLVSLSALFSASKLEDEFAPSSELARAHAEDEDKARTLEENIRRFEVDLLTGCNFDLRIAHADRYLAALAGEGTDLKLAELVAAAFCLTDACLLHPPEVLALAALMFATKVPPRARLLTDAANRAAAALADDPNLASLVAFLKQKDDPPPLDGLATKAVKPLHKRLKKVALWRLRRPEGDPAPTGPHSPPPPSTGPLGGEEAHSSDIHASSDRPKRKRRLSEDAAGVVADHDHVGLGPPP